MDAGSPELTSEVKRKYKFDSRFLDDMLRVSWDTAFTYAAKAMIIYRHALQWGSRGSSAARAGVCAGNDRDDEGRGHPHVQASRRHAGPRDHRQDGQHPDERWVSMRCWTPGSGRSVRSRPRAAAIGRTIPGTATRIPSHPWIFGVQGSDCDLSDMRFSKLNTSWGKNFVENKMPEAHWKLECIERGARIVVITPEYNPTAYRADYWMPLRPASDGAIFLGAMKIIVDENMHDVDFLKGYTDSPMLVRTDTLQFLDPRDVVADYKFPDFSNSYSGRVQSLKPASG